MVALAPLARSKQSREMDRRSDEQLAHARRRADRRVHAAGPGKGLCSVLRACSRSHRSEQPAQLAHGEQLAQIRGAYCVLIYASAFAG